MSASFDAVIFDLDGVLTDTATVHLRAWSETFNAFLAERLGEGNFREFGLVDYLEFVDGKPRYDGVASFLNARDIKLPRGEPSDHPGFGTVCALGNHKNERFNELLDTEGVKVLPGSIELLGELERHGIAIAVATSSRNARRVLAAAGIPGPFGALIDGEAAARRGLAGKPAPDAMLAAAEELGVFPDRAVLVEDAVAGIQAAVAGGFGLVVGIAGGHQAVRLRSAGADLIAADLSELDLERIVRWFAEELERACWSIEHHGADPRHERRWEALSTVGNGWLATRGAAEEGRAGGLHYPGTYRAGLYNRLQSRVADRAQAHEDMVNLPNWLPVRFRIGEDDWLDPENAEVLEIRRRLDLRAGLLHRGLVVRDDVGRETKVESRRFVSMAAPRLATLAYAVEPLNYEEPVTVRSGLDGGVANRGVPRYADLEGDHLELAEADGAGPEVWLTTRTRQSRIEIALASRSRFSHSGRTIEADPAASREGSAVFSTASRLLRPGETLSVEKLVALHTSLDPEPGPTLDRARAALAQAPDLAGVEAAHRRIWAELWEQCDVVVEGDRLVQTVLRLNTYHLLISVGPHHGELDAGIPARGLHGEAYRGHIFWDEMFVLPFYLLHLPETARAVLLYRSRRLGRARAEAVAASCKGALFPWQSGSDGGEETPSVHLNPQSGIWGPDYSRLQRHVSLAIAYNVWRYQRATGDLDFLIDHGAELLVEIARFWADLCRLDAERDRYSIRGVMGPDEFHESYPGSAEAGLDDNAYSALMVAWLLSSIPRLLIEPGADRGAALLARLGVTDAELDRWADIARRLHVPVSEAGVIEQFTGFFDLLELDWDGYRERYGNVGRLDRVLKAEGDSPDRYQALKQADALMPFYLLPRGELDGVLESLGLPAGGGLLEKTFEYYLPRTTHGSTLSALVHGRLAERLGRRELARRLFRTTLCADYEDVQGGTTGEGIHTGTMAGSHLWVVEDLVGTGIQGDRLTLEPRLPEGWRRIACRIRHRGARFGVELTRESLRIELLEAPQGVEIEVRGEIVSLDPGDHFES